MDPRREFPDARPAPEGWVMRTWPKTFAGQVGPLYFRNEGGPPGVGFYSEPHHGNIGGVVHGGMLMTLADMALFRIAWDAAKIERAVTLTLNAEFLAPGPIGEFIEASGDVVKAGKSVIFVRGLIVVGDKSLLSFSGTLKRIT